MTEHPAPSFLTTPSGDRLAYHRLEGASPGIVFMGGFMSDMTGSKALRLEGFCRAREQAFLRFDYHGHGQSEGRFAEGTIGRWAGNAIDAIDMLTQGRQLFVGSSMGGWIMLLAALARPDVAAGLIGVAAAPDFTENLIWKAMTEEQKRDITEKGVLYVPSEYSGEPYPITLQLIEEARRHLLLRDGTSIPLTCPVRLLHGMQDADVPWTLAPALANRLASQDVQVTLIKDGDHRLSDETNLQLLEETLHRLLA